MHEPDASLDYNDPVSEEGGSYSWDGKLIGAGSLTHRVISPPTLIEDEIRFIRPFKSSSKVSWNLEPDGEGTRVTWSMKGKMPFLFRPMLPMMTGMLVKDYQLGLILLKGELEPESEYPTIEFDGIEHYDGWHVISVPFEGHYDEMIESMEKGFTKLFSAVNHLGVEPAGMPLSAYHKADHRTQQFACDMAVPVEPGTTVEGFESKQLAGGRFYCVTLKGDYRFLELAWFKAMSHIQMLKLKHDKLRPSYELYLTDPEDVSHSNDNLTRLLVAIR